MKKVLCYLAGAVAIVAAAGLSFTVYCNAHLKTGKKTYDVKEIEEIKEADFAIVPGCLVYKSGRPSYALEDRLNGAYQLYQNGKVKQLILSGAARENAAGKKFLLEKGMKEADIRIDDGGLDTYSTIYRCRDAFPGKTFLVCTQKKYFKRTGYLIQQLEMKGNCVGIDVHSYKKEGYEKFRDFFAADKAWIECNITKPAPEYSLKELPVQ